MGTEGQRTLARLVNGITYAARVYTDTSNSAALELETLAGSYLLAAPNTTTPMAGATCRGGLFRRDAEGALNMHFPRIKILSRTGFSQHILSSFLSHDCVS